MRSHRIVTLGASIVLLGAALTACTPPAPQRIPSDSPPPVTGAAGDTGSISPPSFATTGAGGALVATGAGGEGSTCVNGVAVAPPGLTAGKPSGPPPQIPTSVVRAATPVPPLSGGSLLALADGVTVVASDPDRDQVYLVDLTGGTVRATVLQPGDEPGRLIEDAAGRVHVVLRRGGAIATIDPKTATVTARRAVCAAPRGIAYQTTGDLVHVACAGGELVSLPAAGGAATRTVTLDRDLRDVVVGANGTLLVSTFRKAGVLVVGVDGTVSARMQPGSGMVPTIFGMPQMRTPSVAWRMVSRGDSTGSVVMLHQTGVTDSIDPVAGGYAGLMGCGGIVQSSVTMLAPGADAPSVAAGLSQISLAVDVAISPDQTMIAVAAPGNAETQGMPTLVEGPMSNVAPSAQSGGAGADGSGANGAAGFGGTSAGPCGQSIAPVASPPPGEVISVAYSQAGVLFAQTREPAAIWRGDTGTTISLASDTRPDTGHLIFHANAGGGLACASCHPEGGEDGRVWNFVCAGARRTQSIRGGISPTAPFHWDGSEHDFSHLMDDVFTGRMAGPTLNTDQKDALQAWVDTIPAMPEMGGLDSAAVVRGAMLFDDPKVACATCHAGTLLTNNATVDVGTGQALQVPSLRGVSWRAPFMHNGCASTLTERFTNPACSGGDKHGVTSTLTAAQISDLTAYLQSL